MDVATLVVFVVGVTKHYSIVILSLAIETWFHQRFSSDVIDNYAAFSF